MAGCQIKTLVALGMLARNAAELIGKDSPATIDTGWAVRSAVTCNVFVDAAQPEFTFRDAPPAGILLYEVKDW